MSSKNLRRDAAVDSSLRALRHAHRGYRQAGHTGRRANVDAKRGAAVFASEEVVWGVEPVVVACVGARPSASDWRAARAGLRASQGQDQRLVEDLRRVRFNPGPVLTSAEIRDAVVAASVRYQAVIDETRSRRADDASGNLVRLRRSEKDRLRNQARREFEAVLAGLAVAVTAARNPGNAPLHTVACGALTAG